MVISTLLKFVVIFEEKKQNNLRNNEGILSRDHLVDTMLIFNQFILSDVNWLTIIGYPLSSDND